MVNKKKYSNCDEIYKSLQKYFTGKAFDIGDRVPSERDIADELGVNRTTLRGAMHRMVDDGLLERQVGVGTFFKISPNELAQNHKKISTKCSVTELLEARIMLEPKLAHLAAINVSGNDIKMLRELCKTKTKGNKLEALDIDFHDMLANFSKNPMLKQMYSIVSDLRKKLADTSADVCWESYECAETWKEHQLNIIAALEKRDSKAAYNAVKKKLDCMLGQYSLLN